MVQTISDVSPHYKDNTERKPCFPKKRGLSHLTALLFSALAGIILNPIFTP